MSDFGGGPDGAQAIETEIAEADHQTTTVRYRGVSIEDLVGRVTFGNVWGLLVDDRLNPGLPAGEPFPALVRTGDVRVDLQCALAQIAPVWGLRPLLDIDAPRAREDLARASVLALDLVAQSARGREEPRVSQREIDRASTLAHRFLTRWRGDPDPRHIEALEAYWVCMAEHGLTSATLAARVTAGTGADVGACLSAAVGALSGPLHGGAPARVLRMLQSVEKTGDPRGHVRAVLDRGERIMGFGHRVDRSEDPRARVLRGVAQRLGAPRYEVAASLEKAALEELAERHPSPALRTNAEFWAAVVLDFAQVPARLFTSLLACSRTAGWTAHILEQRRHGHLIRPQATYVGHAPRGPEQVEGWDIALAKGQVR